MKHLVKYEVQTPHLAKGSVQEHTAGPYASRAEADENARDIAGFEGIQNCRVVEVPDPELDEA